MADNREYVYRALRRELGLTPAQAAGAVGGMTGESGRGLSTTAKNPSSGAYGIAQWLGGRKSSLFSRPNPSSLRTQTQHLISELKGPERGALNALRGAKNIDQATDAWVLKFERPGAHETTLGPRRQQARQAFREFRGVSGGSGGGGGGGAAGGSTVTTQPGAPAAPDFGSAQSALPLIQALVDSQKQQAPSAGVAAPAFSAQAALPSGYQGVQSGGGPAPKPDIGALADTIKTLGSEIPQVEANQDTPAPTTYAEAGEADPQAGKGSYGSGRGKFKITGPNPGRIQPQVRNFMSSISSVLGGETVVGSDGTGHSKYTTTGNVSEHFTGSASDIPARGEQLMKLGRAALIAAGMDPKKARKAPGGLYNVTRGGKRYQIIFGVSGAENGGDHTDHLHIGVSRRR